MNDEKLTNRTFNSVKTPEELLYISKAAAIGDVCMDHVFGMIRPGIRENELAEEIDSFLMMHTGEGLAFPTICVSGKNSADPHGVPTDKKIEKGDFLVMDFGMIVEGFCADMTRTFAIGEVDDEQRKIYNTVLKAQIAGLRAVKSGVRCSDIDKICRDVIEDAGYGEYYIHGTGHGVGREAHEPPTINQRSDEILNEYEAITIEPGIYIPDKYGVRIEDLAIVTDFGIINLVHTPKELTVIC